MGWLFRTGITRRELIEERSKDWSRQGADGTTITTKCLAHCCRGNVLWAVWERRFTREDKEVGLTERWITCDLLRYQSNSGWGYKDMDESVSPYYFTCPLKYLDLVPLDQFGGNAEWRECVRSHHVRQQRRRKRQAV